MLINENCKKMFLKFLGIKKRATAILEGICQECKRVRTLESKNYLIEELVFH
jgi:hypothetical protein